MKQVAQNYRSGELAVLDVPAPSGAPGGVLVRSLYSLISTGTELMKVGEARMSLLAKARARPDQVKKVLESVAQQGVLTTYEKVINRLDSYTPLGYSVCGIVTEVGDGAEEFHVGQLVAAGGNEFALHAEYNWVPKNLCVAVPDGVPPEHAAFSTVGAIAMHGVRQADIQLGETVCVIGMGLVGQLVVRLLIASGARVFGLDPVAERCAVAEQAGAIACAAPDDDGIAVIDKHITSAGSGIGADHVIITAGGSSNEPVEVAARLARDRARVVDIGKTRLDLPWNAYYDKELEVRFSRSYGPGRYDDSYEIDGIDYPAGYVRWTERRNLECFVDLLAREQIDIEPLVTGVFPIAEATEVYGKLSDGSLAGIGFLFEYPDRAELTVRGATRTDPAVALPRTKVRRGHVGGLRLGFVGAGNYATSMLLPTLADANGVTLAHVATKTSLSAATARRRFSFERASTAADAVLDDDSLDAVFIVTRHSSHADLVCKALERGLAVFVEKPLALTDDDLDRIQAVVEATGNDRLMVGFNRRFAPLLVGLRNRFGADPSAARYLVNAGVPESSSWYLDEKSEGSRFAGEGGHFIDTLSWWFGSVPSEVHAVAGPNPGELHAMLGFRDGSAGTISYLTGGHNRFPKETFDVSGGGRSARLDNFRSTTLWSGRRRSTQRNRGRPDKGQAAQLARFIGSVRSGGPMPIPLDSLIATTRATIAVQRGLASGHVETV